MNRNAVLFLSALAASIAMAAFLIATVPERPPGPPLKAPPRELPLHAMRPLFLVMWTAFFLTMRTLYWFANDKDRQREAAEASGCIFAWVNFLAGVSLFLPPFDGPWQFVWGAVFLLMAAWGVWRSVRVERAPPPV